MVKQISILLILSMFALSASPIVYAQSKSKSEKAGEKAARTWDKTKEKSKNTWHAGKKEAKDFGKGWKNERAKMKEEKKKKR